MGEPRGSGARTRSGKRLNPGIIGVDSPDSGNHGVPGTVEDPGAPPSLTVSLRKLRNRRSVCGGVHFALARLFSFSFYRSELLSRGKQIAGARPKVDCNKASCDILHEELHSVWVIRDRL